MVHRIGNITPNKPSEPSSADSQKTIAQNGGDKGVQNSYISTLFHILAVSVGPMVFSLPSAFSMVGCAASVLGILVAGLITAYNLRLFLKCCHKMADRRKVDRLTFADSVRFSLEDSPYKLQRLAPAAAQIINVLMLLTWAGELSFNVVFMCRNLRFVFAYHAHTSISVHLVLAACALPCILLSSIPNLRISCLSIVAGTIDLLFLGVVVFEVYGNAGPADPAAAPLAESWQKLRRLPNFLAVVLFTLNFSGIVLPLKNDMKNSRKFDTRFGTLTVAVAIICVVDAVFGLLGYLRYGDGVQEMITLNLPVEDVFIRIMICLYGLAIYFTYPVYFLVVFRIVWDEWIPSGVKKLHPHWWLECVARVALNLLLFALMFLCPRIRLFTNIGGLICAIINSLIVPSMVQILLLEEGKKARRIVIVARNVVIIIVGLVLLCFGLVECFDDLINAN